MPNTLGPAETILEPDLPIVDPHHHLWDWPADFLAGRPTPAHGFDTVIARSMRYLLPEFLADLNSGHNIRATVYVQCTSMYRADGPEPFKPVGETEFVNGVAAMCASGRYGDVRACAGIVGHVDLTLGSMAGAVLEAHMKAAGERFKGIRHAASYDADSNVLGPLVRAGGTSPRLHHATSGPDRRSAPLLTCPLVPAWRLGFRTPSAAPPCAPELPRIARGLQRLSQS